MIEIIIRYLRQKYVFGETIIAEARIMPESQQLVDKQFDINETLTIKGESAPEEFQPNQTYRIMGRFTDYRNKRTGKTETQFSFSSFTEHVSNDRESIIDYITNQGRGCGIGLVKATKLVDEFGIGNVLNVCRTDPQRVSKITSITIHNATEFCDKLTEKAKTESTTISVGTLLAGNGFPRTLAKRVIKKWGSEAPDIIRETPYKLMQFRGVGFNLADRLYLKLGKDPSSIERQSYALHWIVSKSSGDVWLLTSDVIQKMSAIFTDKLDFVAAVRYARDQIDPPLIATVKTDPIGQIKLDARDTLWIADHNLASLEIAVAKKVVSIQEDDTFDVISALTELFGEIDQAALWPNVSEIEGITGHQRDQLALATKGRLGILGGSPGTGKSYTLAKLIRHGIEAGIVTEDDIGIMAPTGKACVRINELLRNNQIDITARTCHSHLQVNANSEGDGFRFQHNAENSFPFRWVIIDETSMVDLPLFNAILEAVPVGCNVLLLGDVNQLPPVGPGFPLRDLINSGIPYGELREIKRSTGGIVEVCAAIRDGKPWKNYLSQPGTNIALLSSNDANDQVERLIHNLKSLDVDSVWECQVLIAVNENSLLSKENLNQRLQSEFNSNPQRDGTKFRVNDKVVCLKNGFYKGSSGGLEYAANGDLGRVASIDNQEIVIEMDQPKRLVSVPIKQSSNDNETGAQSFWDLAYALTVHKFQGSESPFVYVILDEYPGAKMICDKSWIYTAISRAKKRCILVGQYETALAMCRRTKNAIRKTFLKERIGIEQAEMVTL